MVSGCVNQSGLLRVQVTKRFGESTVSKILDLVENASSKKAPAENFITKFARYYTPCVVIGAVLLAVLPPPVTGMERLERVERMDPPCPHLFGYLLPLCAGHFGAAQLFRRIGGASRCGFWSKAATIWKRWLPPMWWCLTKPAL